MGKRELCQLGMDHLHTRLDSTSPAEVQDRAHRRSSLVNPERDRRLKLTRENALIYIYLRELRIYLYKSQEVYEQSQSLNVKPVKREGLVHKYRTEISI